MRTNFKFTNLRLLCVLILTTFLTTLTFTTIHAQIPPSTAEERLNGLKKRKILEEKSVLKDIKFRNIGPTVMSGRVVDISVNPSHPIEFYIAYATGGLWHTVNNGQSFIPLFDNQDATGIGAIAVNWNTHEIWVGTGEANSSRSSYSGLGVYKSIDLGKTWQYIGLPESHHIGKIILHPTEHNVAWVAVLGHLYSPNKERGIYKTSDGGITWKQTLYVDENAGAVDMDIDQKNPDIIYASTWHRERRSWNFVESGFGSAIFKSMDGGNSWKPVSQPGSGFPSGKNVGRIGLSVYQADPSIIYATVDNQDHRPDTATKKKDSLHYTLKDFKNLTKEQFLALNKSKLDSFLIKNEVNEIYRDSSLKEMVRSGKEKPSVIYDYLNDADNALFDTPIVGCEVYRSDDYGLHWKKVNTQGLNLYNTYGYYFGKISVAGNNANKVVISGFNLMLSEDGGKTFKVVDKRSTHPDWHGCWINPLQDSNWVAYNDGGCNITYDNGKHWFKANSTPVAQFYAIDVDNAKPYNVYGGIQDNGVWYGTSATKNNEEWDFESGDAWKNIGGGDGMQVQVDSRDNKTVYSGSQFGYYNRTNTDVKHEKSIHPKPDLDEEHLRFNWQTPILLSRHNQDIFYMGTNRFYRSMNKGEKMEAISKDLTSGKKPGNVPFGTLTTLNESPLKFGLLYAGSDDGNVQVSKDDGYTWTQINSGLPMGLYVSRVVASQYKEQRVYVTMNAYRNDNFTPFLFVSEDYGTTWKAIGTDLPTEPLNVVKEDPKNENIIYVGTDNGLYASLDAGNTFMTFDGNIPRVAVHDIAIQKAANEIVVATHGRSIYIASLDEVQKKVATEPRRNTKMNK